ncbi:hypothetical protein ACFWY5_51925 [Nonomuraea sp. NPDC059007]|uniref:hypothetical protein n=1 Tax=Nonomuraea sp. NPDC059007 TaxID=3346692 RepID=UPI0036AEB465
MEDSLHRPARTQGAAGEVGTSADELRAQLDNFRREVEGDGGALGGDDLGMLIGAVYAAIHEMAFGSYSENTDDLKAVAADIETMGANQKMGEDLNLIEVNNVKKLLG